MQKYFVLTIDVEPDCTSSWHYSNPLTFDGVSIGIKERLQPLFNKYDVCPTYLINNVVLEDQHSTEVFLNLAGKFELGTHLHSEFIGPQAIHKNYAGKKGEANQCFLAPEIEFEKMKNITLLFEKNFDKKPTSFRAGRFSAGVNTVKCLEKLGYKVDTSVTPHVNWSDKTREIPIDYRAAWEQPYFIKKDSYLEEDINGAILEVPVSIISQFKLYRKKPVWLRPVHSSNNDFLKIIKSIGKNHSQNGNIIYNMMFHNVEVLPNKSPYTKNEKDCLNYLNQLEFFFKYCQKNNIKSIALSETYDLYKK